MPENHASNHGNSIMVHLLTLVTLMMVDGRYLPELTSEEGGAQLGYQATYSCKETCDDLQMLGPYDPTKPVDRPLTSMPQVFHLAPFQFFHTFH